MGYGYIKELAENLITSRGKLFEVIDEAFKRITDECGHTERVIRADLSVLPPEPVREVFVKVLESVGGLGGILPSISGYLPCYEDYKGDILSLIWQVRILKDSLRGVVLHPVVKDMFEQAEYWCERLETHLTERTV